MQPKNYAAVGFVGFLSLFVIAVITFGFYAIKHDNMVYDHASRYTEWTQKTSKVLPFNDSKNEASEGPFIAESTPWLEEEAQVWCIKWSYHPYDKDHKKFDTSITTDPTLKPGDPIKVVRLELTDSMGVAESRYRNNTPIVIRDPNTKAKTLPAEKP